MGKIKMEERIEEGYWKRPESERGNFWYRPRSRNPLANLVIGTLALAMPFLIWGAKAKLEGKLEGSDQYKPTEQKQVYEVNDANDSYLNK